MVDCIYSAPVHPKIFGMKLSFLLAIFSVGFPKETLILFQMNVGRVELQRFNSSTYGCLAKVLIPEPKKRKIGPKTVDVVFIGYTLDSNISRFLVVNSEISEYPTTQLLKLEMTFTLKSSFLSNIESLLILLVFLLSLIFLHLVSLHPLTQNLGGAKELKFSRTSEKISSPILLKMILTPLRK